MKITIKNANLISVEEKNILIDVTKKAMKKYNCDKFDNYTFEYIEISKRLKTSGGNAKMNIKKRNIKVAIAFNHYQEFGFDSFKKVLLHEIAHVIEYIIKNDSSHNEDFKRICSDIGGVMNRKHAGIKYLNCASDNFVKPVYQYEYTCNCGVTFKKKRKATTKYLFNRGCYRCNSRLTSFKCEKIN